MDPKDKKVPAAIEYFRQLQKTPPSIQLDTFLSSFAAPKNIDDKTFADGVKKFIQMANSNSLDTHSEQGRMALYPTRMSFRINRRLRVENYSSTTNLIQAYIAEYPQKIQA